jgi:hypothetical protein
MWEELKVYRQLEKTQINPTFKKLGTTMQAQLKGYSLEKTGTCIKLYRLQNGLEQAIFIEKSTGTYDLNVSICIKPFDFYLRHKFTKSYVVPLGDIMGNHRRSSYPLTQEWMELSVFLVTRINNEISKHFERYDSYEKIITQREEIEDKPRFNESLGLLIYAAIKTKQELLLDYYLDKKKSSLPRPITYSEFVKPDAHEIDEVAFLNRIKVLGLAKDFDGIEQEIRKLL